MRRLNSRLNSMEAFAARNLINLTPFEENNTNGGSENFDLALVPDPK